MWANNTQMGTKWCRSNVCPDLLAAILAAGVVIHALTTIAGEIPLKSDPVTKGNASAAVLEKLPVELSVYLARYDARINGCFENNRFQEERDLRAEYTALLARVFGTDDWHTQTQRLYHASSTRIWKLAPADQADIAAAREYVREGIRLKATRDYQGAQRAFEKALDVYKRLLGGEDVWCIATRVRLAEVQQWSGRVEDSKSLWNEVLPAIKVIYGEHSPCYAQPLQNLAICNWRLGLYAEAESQLRKALEIQQRANGVDSYEAAISHYHLAGLYNDRHDSKQAEQEARRAISVVTRLLPDKHKECILAYCQLGKSCCEQRNYIETVAACARAIELMERFHAAPPAKIHAELLDNYCMSLRKLNRDEEANKFEKKAAALRVRQARRPDSPQTLPAK